MRVRVRTAPVFDRAVVGFDRLVYFALRVVGGAQPEVRLRELRGLFERLPLSADRFLKLAFAEISKSEIVIRFGEFAVPLIYGCSQRGNRAVKIPKPVTRSAEISKRAREYRLLLDRQPKLARGLLEHSQVGKRKTEVVMRAREIAAPLLNGRAYRCDRFFELAALIQRDAELVMSFRKVLVLRDCGSKRFNRLIELVLGRVDPPHLVMSVRVATAAQRDCGSKLFLSFRHSAKTVKRDPKIVMRAREARYLLDGFSIGFDGVFKIALSCEHHAEIVISPREVLPLRDACAIRFDRIGKITATCERSAQRVVRFWVNRLLLKRDLSLGDRVFELPKTKQRAAELEVRVRERRPALLYRRAD